MTLTWPPFFRCKRITALKIRLSRDFNFEEPLSNKIVATRTAFPG